MVVQSREDRPSEIEDRYRVVCHAQHSCIINRSIEVKSKYATLWPLQLHSFEHRDSVECWCWCPYSKKSDRKGREYQEMPTGWAA